MVLEIFKIALLMRDRHVFIRESLEILNVPKTLILQQIFWRTKTFLKKLEYCFLVESANTENASFSYNAVILRQIDWRVRNGTITKNGVLPVTALFLWKFCFSVKTSYKELIWCTNYLNIHIHNFRKRWSFIRKCF